jgi:hypothetical protein
MRQHGFTGSMNVGSGNMKCPFALNSIAARYARHSMLNGYQTDCATAFLAGGDSVFDRSAPQSRAPPIKELPVTTLPNIFIGNLIGVDPGAFSDTAAPCGRPRPQIKIN